MKKALIIGASSGIGKELAITLAKNGYEVGLMARRLELLDALQQQISTKTYVGHIDLSQASEAIDKMQQMIQEMGEVDLIIINSGTGFLNPELDWLKERQTLDVNVYGFCALAGVAFNCFSKQGHGHLVGISSIGALRGNHIAPAYNASKAFMSNYLEGLRKKAFKNRIQIIVTDIRPGFVDTDMAKGEGKFWVASPSKAAEQIYSAIQSKKSVAYITHRWCLIGWLLKIMPNWIYKRLD
jgi:short-subunit dehydrogenase